MARFINDDVMLRYDGRKAVKITPAELAEKMFKQYRKLNNATDAEMQKIRNEGAGETLMGLFETDAVIEKDMRFVAYCENLYYDRYYCHNGHLRGMAASIGDPLINFQTLSNGLTFFGFLADDDGGIPCFMIIYYDGENLRLYTPIRGNFVNVDCESELGSEGCYCKANGDMRFDEDALEQKYRKLGIWSDSYDANYMTMYLSKYNLNTENIFFNWDAIREDIEAQIQVV
jgi:hypothetical protein